MSEGEADTKTAEPTESKTSGEDLSGLIKKRDELLASNRDMKDKIKDLTKLVEELKPLAEAETERKKSEQSELDKAQEALQEALGKVKSMETEIAKRDRWMEIRRLATDGMDDDFLRGVEARLGSDTDPEEVANQANEKWKALKESGQVAEIPGQPGGTVQRTSISEEQKIKERYVELGKRRGDNLAMQERIAMKLKYPFLRDLPLNT